MTPMQVLGAPELAPGVPPDYYRSIADAEEAHWWHRAMVVTSVALLGPKLEAGGRVLDAGCGTGGFIRFLHDEGRFASLAGVDIAAAAIVLAREQVPEANLRVAPLHELPFDDAAFDLVVTNDVLQHVPEQEVEASLLELRRVLAPGGALLLRTNGSRQFRRERDDWRAYDRATLLRELEATGFVAERVSYANCVLSLAAAARGRVPHAPTTEHHGIPPSPSGLAALVGRATMAAEAWWLGRGGSLPYGHTLIAIARAPESRA